MAITKKLIDEYGIIYEANNKLPQELKLDLLEALAELENNECHKKREFPKTRLHRVVGYTKYVYRADIDKISGWRINLQYSKSDNSIVLKDIIEGQRHDDVIKIIKSKKYRYE